MTSPTSFLLRDSGSARPLSSNAVVAMTFVAALVILAVASGGPNLDLALASVTVLLVGTALLWRPGEPPILLLVFIFQWMQATVAILQATFTGQTVDAYYPQAGPVSEATYLSLATLVCLALGMRLAAGRIDPELRFRAQLQSARGRMANWFAVYVIFWCVGAAALFGAQLAPPLAQVFLGIDSLRWAFFFMLAVVHFERGGSAGFWFPAAFAFEFVLSIGGFFSEFKTVFFVTFLGAMFAGVKVSVLRILAAGLVAVAAFAMAVVWTAIKPEYRAFVTGGEAIQGVTVDYPDQVMKIGELVSELDQQALSDATTDFLDRLSYVEFFGSVLAHVPQNVAHENGALLADAFARPFTPRVLFPEKTEINDSERTRYYTGRSVSGVETGTSISIGWIAEVYIDFGRWGMLLAGVAIGGFYGLIYRYLTRWRRTKGLLGFGMATAVLLPATFLESSITKVIGGVTVATIAAFMIARFVVPLVSPWIQRSAGRSA